MSIFFFIGNKIEELSNTSQRNSNTSQDYSNTSSAFADASSKCDSFRKHIRSISDVVFDCQQLDKMYKSGGYDKIEQELVSVLRSYNHLPFFKNYGLIDFIIMSGDFKHRWTNKVRYARYQRITMLCFNYFSYSIQVCRRLLGGNIPAWVGIIGVMIATSVIIFFSQLKNIFVIHPKFAFLKNI